MRNSWTRSLLSSVFRPFPVSIDYLDAAGNQKLSYRFIPMAGYQILIYPVVSNNEELLATLAVQGGGRHPSATRQANQDDSKIVA